jgi:quinol monooxygenase YgiN
MNDKKKMLKAGGKQRSHFFSSKKKKKRFTFVEGWPKTKHLKQHERSHLSDPFF